MDSHYSLPQDDGWFMRRWPSGVRPTESTCGSGFIYGAIKQGDYEKVRALYRRNHPFMHSFILASPGGDVAEAMKIGRLFRKYLIHVIAPMRIKERNYEFFFLPVLPGDEPECGVDHNECTCASACALIWFGAVGRFGSVGLHRPRIDDPSFKALGPKDAAAIYGRVLNSIRQYMDEMEAPKPLIEAMVATGSADIKWVADHDGLKRPPSLAEWEDANCGTLSEGEAKLLSDLTDKKRSTLTRQEQSVRDQLEKRSRTVDLCKIELLSSHRDMLLPP
jgi:hypothetical protein